MIRTVQIAKHLGVSPRDLREKVLSKVNIPGVKPTDKEMSLALASGVVRIASRMLKIAYEPLESVDDVVEEMIVPDEDADSSTVDSAPKEKVVIRKPIAIKRGNFSTLEKLRGIGNKSQGDQARKAKEAIEKEELEKKELEAREAEKTKKVTVRKKPILIKKTSQVRASVLRKIEITPEEAEAARLKKEERDAEKERKKQEDEAAILERKLLRKKRQEQIFTKKEGVVEIASQLSVKEFSEKIGVPVSQVIGALMKNGMMVNVTQNIDFDTASIIADELEVELKQEESRLSAEDLLSGDLSTLLIDEPENLKPRPPVIAVVGHVDHGKTSLLDAIRSTKVTDGESGGITQHIGAYSITKQGRDITFLDTPGHAAFTSMRSRGAKTADIVILVVAADDGVKPQTIEAINHAKAAGAIIIVAANKIDKPEINLDKLRGELSEYSIQVEEWGGNIPMVQVSAKTGQGIDDLLEMVFLQSEMLELKANPKRLAVGTVIEAHRDPSLGPVATILVNTGTMKMRDRFILGSTWGRVKLMSDEEGKRLKQVLPSGAARISGINDIPQPGDIFQVIGTEKELKLKKQELEVLKETGKKNAMGVVDISHNIKAGNMKTLNVVLKTDTTGSMEAIEQSLNDIGANEVKVKIIHKAIGGVTDNDVIMASASDGIVVSFHADVSTSVKRTAEKEGVDIQEYDVIYTLIEDIAALLEGLIEPQIITTKTGELKVKGVFFKKGKRQIVGGKVEKGFFEHPSRVTIFRKEEEMGTLKLVAIQHFEDKVKKIESPKECGLELSGNIDDILEGDIIIGYEVKTILRSLDDVKKQEAEKKMIAEAELAKKKAEAEEKKLEDQIEAEKNMK